ncbi:MAG: hypothetical protein WC455_13995 [Dehalococcoidia bacterium]|jgi:hypothetical protein
MANSWDTITEYAYNTQATINTNDTSSFATGENGTAILSNTAITYYYVRFSEPIKPTDRIIVEVRSKINPNVWIEAKDATGAAFESLGIVANTSGTGYVYGIGMNVINSTTVKVFFGSYAAIDCSAGAVSRRWATMLGYSDGFDRWRVRKS